MLNCLQATGCNDGLFQQTVVFSNPTLFYSIPNNQNLDKPHLAAPRTILGKKKKKKKSRQLASSSPCRHSPWPRLCSSPPAGRRSLYKHSDPSVSSLPSNITTSVTWKRDGAGSRDQIVAHF